MTKRFAAYLYFFDQTGSVKSYEHFDPTAEIKSPESLGAKLVINAVTDGNNPPCYCTNVKDMYRRRPSYIFIAVENGAFSDTSHPEFNLEKSSTNANEGHKPAAYTINYVKSFPVTFDVHVISVAIYTNDMLGYHHPSTKLIDKEWEEFSWDSPTLSQLRFGDDSGGTNMGPAPFPPGIYNSRRSNKMVKT